MDSGSDQHHIVVCALREYFGRRPDVCMAFLFGSRAKGTARQQSDLDVAVYFTTEPPRLEWEARTRYAQEGDIWSDVERIAGLDTDLVVLNRAPAPVAFAALREGEPLLVRDRSLYWRLFLMVSDAAQDDYELVEQYRQIRRRSESLTAEDAYRLSRVLDFLETELRDRRRFEPLTRESYETLAPARREVERWVENLVNAALDMAKILLASDGKPIPATYRELALGLRWLEGLDDRIADELADFARLQNILAHDYLDVRFAAIRRVIESADVVFGGLARWARSRLGEPG
jgi:uncharacterized protein YutE (UPF0331/DUF86 family)/predicted nucleotidyltransferase